MPAVLTVDQSLVDAYLARVDRFVKNVERFEKQLKDAVKDRLAPEQIASPPDIEHQAPVTAKADQAVVTADDIDIDALLSGVDLGEMTI